MATLVGEEVTDMAPVPLPPGYHSVNPYIVVAGAARLIDFLSEVFGGVEQGRELRDDGAIEHADVLIGDSLVMLSEASPEYPHVRACTLSTSTMSISPIAARLKWARARSWHQPISGGVIAWAGSWIRSTTAGGSRPISGSSAEAGRRATGLQLAMHGQYVMQDDDEGQHEQCYATLVTLFPAIFAQLALVDSDPEQAALLAGAAQGLPRRVGLWGGRRTAGRRLPARFSGLLNRTLTVIQSSASCSQWSVSR